MNKFFLVTTIVILATILRFNQLSLLPALNADEAAIGYNAYSLLQTGRDEHGNPWPIHFQSFNDYKPGLYFYIVLPFVWLFGLTEMAVRLPGAFLGITTVIVVWFLIRELFPKQLNLAYISALFLAISPWHIHFSRGGWEVNAATFFIALGILGILKGRRSGKWLIIGTVAFITALYTYHATRVIVPLLGVGLLLLYKDYWLKHKKILIFITLLSFILLAPLLKELNGPAFSSRASGVSIFADPGVIDRINEQRGEHEDMKSLTGKILHNKVVNYSIIFMYNWTRHFWGEFLFLSGDEIQRNRVPETGVLYLFDLPLVLIGLFMIARSPKGWEIIIWWLLIAPTAAALTFQSPHALRALNMAIPFTVISAFGLVSLIDRILTFHYSLVLRSIVLMFIGLIIVWNFSRYIHYYYDHMAKAYPYSSQYGLKELVYFINQNYEKYENFVITDTYDQPYIFFVFYSKYPPQKFQSNHTLSARDKFGFSTVRSFDKFRFESIANTGDAIQRYPKSLIVGSAKEVAKETNVIKEILFPNNSVAFRIIAN